MIIINRKLLCLFTIFILFFCYGNVRAYNLDITQKNVEKKEAILLCEYSNKEQDNSTRVYYYFKNDTYAKDYTMWNVYYSYQNSGNWKEFSYKSPSQVYQSYTNVFIESPNLIYNVDSTRLGENNFFCPNSAFFSKNKKSIIGMGNNKICFDDKTSCGNQFETFDQNYIQTLNDNSDAIFNKLNNYMKKELFLNLDLNELLNENINVKNYIIKKGNLYLEEKFKNIGKDVPLFLKNYVANFNEHIDYSKETSYIEFENKYLESIETKLNNGELTEEKANDLKDKLLDFKEHENNAQNNDDNLTPEEELEHEQLYDDFSTNCEDFAKTLKIVGVLIIILKIALPLIIIVKGSLNVINIVTKGNADEAMNYVKKLAYSIVAGILIFFVPTLINIVFGFIDKYNKGSSDYIICRECIFDPYGDICDNYVKD